MKRKWNRILTVTGTICLLCMSVTACGPTSTASETEENAADSTQMPDSGTGNATSGDADTENARASDTDTSTSQDTTTGSDPADPREASPSADTDTADESDSSGDTDGRWHVLDPETASLVNADFEGTVEKIDSDSFYISEAVTEILDDGTMLMGTAASTGAAIPDSDLLRVVYDDTTRFYIRTIYNGGESYDDSEASSEDLELQALVSLKGEIRDDIFYADEVRISKIG